MTKQTPVPDSAAADQDTARALLAAARAVFAEQGFDGASVRAITGAAGANLGAITYHFGSKRALYEAVLADAISPLADRVIAAAGSERPPLERAGDVVRAFFEFLGANPQVPRFMLQELANGRDFPEAAATNFARILAALTRLVMAGQADGSMRQGEARLMALAMVGHPLHVNLLRTPLRAFAQVDLDDPAVRARLVDNAVRFVQGGLAARGEQS